MTSSARNESWAPERLVAVDLDGTVIRTDLLWESAVRHASSRARGVVELVGWALRGRARLKSELAARVTIDPASLPYNDDVLADLRRVQDAGGDIVIATAAARALAEPVAAHLGLRGGVLATDTGGTNLRGSAKAEAIAARADGRPWVYYGDSRADLEVWARADEAVAVGPSPAVRRALARMDLPIRTIDSARPSPVRRWTSALRVHQWVKNVLVLVPVLASHLVLDPTVLTRSVLAAVAFCAMASSIYLLNDLIDLDADRAHPSKRHRALAAGWVPIPAALVASGALALVAVAIATWLGLAFVGVILVYAAATTLYSAWIKRKIVADVVGLAMLYTWRILAGCVAAMVVPSIWMLAFSTFLFLSLGVMKRYAEIVNHGRSAAGRDYHEVDAPLLLAIGSSSGIAAVLVAVLYLDSPQVNALYSFPEALWAVIPLLVYWIVRFWMVAARGGVDDDPIVFALTDRTSLIVLALIGGAAGIAMLAP